MKIVTAAEMKRIDERTIREFGIPGSVLMERAGLAVARRIQELFEKRKVIVLSGGGNNGGDGIVAARTLHGWGWHVKVLLMLREDRLSPDCLSQYRIAKAAGVAVEFRTTVTDKDLHSAVVVDALLGTGISQMVKPPMADVIRFLNGTRTPVVSVDIPSGISADNGQVMGEAVRADYTVTFGLPKAGHYLFPGAANAGRLYIEDIGFPPQLTGAQELGADLLDVGLAAGLIPERPGYSHKGDYGHVLVLAGSRGRTGAAMLCAKACLRSGAGLVTLGIPEGLVNAFEARVAEEMLLPLPDSGNGTLSAKALPRILEFLDSKADVLALGPGLSTSPDITGLVASVVGQCTVPMVIDADGLNAIAARGVEILGGAKAPLVLTPHPGEMARLLKGKVLRGGVTGVSREETVKLEIEADRIAIVVDFAKRHVVYLVLKGAPTVLADPEGHAFVSAAGNPGMATAGCGDVLTGVIAALLGQGLNPLHACLLGTCVHGMAGDISAEARGMHSLIASDLIEHISDAFLSLSRGSDNPS